MDRRHGVMFVAKIISQFNAECKRFKGEGLIGGLVDLLWWNEGFG